jgi:hypothetical protein
MTVSHFVVFFGARNQRQVHDHDREAANTVIILGLNYRNYSPPASPAERVSDPRHFFALNLMVSITWDIFHSGTSAI